PVRGFERFADRADVSSSDVLLGLFFAGQVCQRVAEKDNPVVVLQLNLPGRHVLLRKRCDRRRQDNGQAQRKAESKLTRRHHDAVPPGKGPPRPSVPRPAPLPQTPAPPRGALASATLAPATNATTEVNPPWPQAGGAKLGRVCTPNIAAYRACGRNVEKN